MIVGVAGLCVLLQTQGEHGTCRKVSQEFEKEGRDPPISCKRVLVGCSSRFKKKCKDRCDKDKSAKTIPLDRDGKKVLIKLVLPLYESPMAARGDMATVQLGKCFSDTHLYLFLHFFLYPWADLRHSYMRNLIQCPLVPFSSGARMK